MNKWLQAVLVIAGVFAIYAIWRDPAVAAQDVGHVFGNIAGVAQEALVKLGEFFGGLGS